jgi:hypothetical protein
MATIFVSGASRVLAPGCLGLFKVRADGSQLRGGLRASTFISLPDLAIPAGAMRDLQANEMQLAALAVLAGIERAFIFEFRSVMLICAGLSLASAAVARRMIARPNLNNR